MAVRRCRKRAADHEESPTGQIGERTGRRLHCGVCDAQLAHPAEPIAIQKAVDHTCTNPAGITYAIRCYRSARLRTEGPPQHEHSWFSGYAWQIACCPRCGSHLGWQFTGRSPTFAGLIRARVEER